MFASGVVILRKRRFGYTRGVLGFTFFTYAVKHVERPGGSHEGVGRKKSAPTWHEHFFDVLQKEPAPNAMSVTMHQLKEADKMLFRKLAEKTRGALAQQPDG